MTHVCQLAWSILVLVQVMNVVRVCHVCVATRMCTFMCYMYENLITMCYKHECDGTVNQYMCVHTHIHTCK